MSLLLDALKRAEQEKLAKQGGAPAEPDRPAAATLAPAASTGSRPNLELQPLASAGNAAPPRADAQAAQNVFQAKEPSAAKASAADTSRKSPVLWIVVAVIAVALLGGGGYVWYTVSSFSPRTAANARPHPAPITAITNLPLDNAPAATPPKVETFSPVQQPSTAIQPGTPQAAAVALETAAKERAAPPPVSQAERVRETVASLLRESSTPAAAAPLKLTQSRESPRVSPDVARGYRELTAGDFAAANKSYSAALLADPLNLDALLGLATIEARAGNRMLAQSLYRRALDIDPRNATALAGIAALSGFSRAEGAESQLRADLATNPSSAALHFTLGNLYAGQGRWGEAQVEYFEAYRIDPASADYAYNLAVSLDHVRQPKVAAEYYERAIEAARTRATQFDPQVAAKRLAEIRG